MQDGEERLVISPEDLPPAEPPSAASGDSGAAASVAPQGLPTVDGVRPAARPVRASGPTLGLGGTWPSNVVAALAAALAGWAAFRLFFSNPTFTTDLVAHAAKEFAVFGAVLAAVFAAWDDATSGDWGRHPGGADRIRIRAIGGAISGAVAQEIYGHLVEEHPRNSSFENIVETYESADFYLTRALGWAIFGLGAGLLAGASEALRTEDINALSAGCRRRPRGLVFHFASIHVPMKRWPS